MGYYVSSNLCANNAAARRAANPFLTAQTGSLSNTICFRDSHSRQYYRPPTDALADTTSNNNSTNDHQSQPIDRNFFNYQGNGQQNTSTPLQQSSVVRPTRLPQLSHSTAQMLPCVQHSARLPYIHSASGTPVETATHRQIRQLITSVSANYLGNPYLAANQSANIPDELNTSVWITNLPPNATHKILLGNVRNCGKVRAAVINGPEFHHLTAAAKIVFFDVAGAQNLLRQAREGSFLVDGYIPRVIPNRIKTEAKPPSPNSRVLHIEGPSCIVNQQYLTSLFQEASITWQDEEVIILWNNGTLTRLEWRFGSYRCQAESARHLIDRVKKCALLPDDQAKMWQGVTVHFGVDPCAPNPIVPYLPTPERPERPESSTTTHDNWRNPADPPLLTLESGSHTFYHALPATQSPSDVLPAFRGLVLEPPLDNPPS